MSTACSTDSAIDASSAIFLRQYSSDIALAFSVIGLYTPLDGFAKSDIVYITFPFYLLSKNLFL